MSGRKEEPMGVSEGTLAEAVELAHAAWEASPVPAEVPVLEGERMAMEDALRAALPVLLGELVPREEYEKLREKLNVERAPWVEEVKSQMVPALRAAERRAERAEAALAECKRSIRDMGVWR